MKSLQEHIKSEYLKVQEYAAQYEKPNGERGCSGQHIRKLIQEGAFGDNAIKIGWHWYIRKGSKPNTKDENYG